MRKEKITVNAPALGLRREARRAMDDAWMSSVIADPQAAKEEFLRGYTATLAEVHRERPSLVEPSKLNETMAKYSEMLQMHPREFAQEVLGVFVDPPDDVRMKRADENVVQCEECPFSLVCLAGRIFSEKAYDAHNPNVHNILCVKCGQLCVVVEEGSAKDMNGITIKPTYLKAQSFYCQERVLTDKMQFKWRHQEREFGAKQLLDKPPWYVDPALTGKWMRLGLCMACEEHDVVVKRYKKRERERLSK